MKPALLSAIVAISFASANNVFAGAQKAVDQLNSQAPQQKAAVLPEASAETTAVVFTENGKPVRTIFFEADKLKFNFGDFFGNNGNNPGNHPGPGPGGHPGDFPGNHPGPGPGGFPGNHPGPGGFPGNSYGRMSCGAPDTG